MSLQYRFQVVPTINARIVLLEFFIYSTKLFGSVIERMKVTAVIKYLGFGLHPRTFYGFLSKICGS
jgi:hypothetical protein